MDDNFDDYFMTDNEANEPAPHVETPQEREDREIEESTIRRRHNSLRIVLLALIVLLCTFLCWSVWQHYFHPYSISQEKDWLMHVSNQGTIFKTYEGEMLSRKFIEDTVLVYQSDFFFSMVNDSVASEAKRWESNGKRVIITYEQYKGVVPWRGNTTRIATKIELDTDRQDDVREVENENL